MAAFDYVAVDASGRTVSGTLTADDETKVTQSIADGAMASVMCVLLRTPRKRLGVLHLDRSFWQNPFTEDDLHLADALAAHVSAAIESAQLLRRQKDQFLKMVSVLAQAVELRDDYTGNHTQRVTRYAIMLGEKLELSDEQLVTEIYLWSISRNPTVKELAVGLDYLKLFGEKDRAAAAQDLMWALLNSREFLMVH